jgi:hypothetical protein
MLRPDATVYDIEAAADLILDSLSSHGPDR